MIQIELREVLMIVVALVGGYAYLARTLATQFKRSNDEQLASLKEAINEGERRSDTHIQQLRSSVSELDRDVRKIKRFDPAPYV